MSDFAAMFERAYELIDGIRSECRTVDTAQQRSAEATWEEFCGWMATPDGENVMGPWIAGLPS